MRNMEDVRANSRENWYKNQSLESGGNNFVGKKDGTRLLSRKCSYQSRSKSGKKRKILERNSTL